MKKSSNINVRITGYLFREINIHGQMINIQHFMLGRTLLNKLLNDQYKQERLPTFWLTYGVYITLILTRVKLEGIANIQFQISTENTDPR